MQDIGPPQKVIQGFGPELFGKTVDDEDIIESHTESVNGLTFYYCEPGEGAGGGHRAASSQGEGAGEGIRAGMHTAQASRNDGSGQGWGLYKWQIRCWA